MSILLNGDCLEELKDIQDKSVDLIFCDLPYGQTSCKWDCPIDLDILWSEIMRIKKINTPIIMTCTTKFGVNLIQSAPKKCPFRYDLVWCKSSSAGFLSSKKQPLRRHELIYFFYEKLPFYDLSSHKHKFLEEKNNKEKTQISKSMDKDLYGASKGGTIGAVHGTNYNPPLPDSLVKTDKNIGTIIKDTKLGTNTYDTEKIKKPIKRLSNDVVYDPPLPNSLIKEGGSDGSDDVYQAKNRFKNGKLTKNPRHLQKGDDPIYDPPLPNSLLEIKSTRGKHSTEKPVSLMSLILKYYSKEGDTILDPTMGSGSMGVACKEMNRNFIGIEKDPEIYEVAVNRIEN